jgi:hypothetical protein
LANVPGAHGCQVECFGGQGNPTGKDQWIGIIRVERNGMFQCFDSITPVASLVMGLAQ